MRGTQGMCLDSLRTRGNRLSSKRRTWDREARMKDGVVSACGCCVQNIRKQRRANLGRNGAAVVHFLQTAGRGLITRAGAAEAMTSVRNRRTVYRFAILILRRAT
ncbi:hypothetical protein OH76DRAFT_87301 [Lentinus brumalis]|uniref:Uncharacterized protein n=1 Tax=Lentinus brumalis TaxID=2498619 RepID=A0A371CQW1_9APHY|nr:hypothetical protein OH76DRAFT_87301 [Polyporus brumalis]